MITIKGNIFDGTWDVFMHCCNTECTWGAGIVVPLKKLYPQAYKADKTTESMGEDKLALYSYADVNNQRIYNLYAQVGIGNDGQPLNRNLQYDYLYDSMFRALFHLSQTKNLPKDRKLVVATPLIGGGLAGGSREIIIAIMNDVFKHYPQFEHHLYEL